MELQQQIQQQQQQIQQQDQQPQQQNNQLYFGETNSTRDNIFKTVNHLPTFTGTGEVTVNSFFSSTEYLLSTIPDENLKKEVIRTIFYKVIQGQAKDVVINLPTPDNWQLIKETLKLRYRPSIEPHHLYKLIANLRVQSVSELIVEIQNIKYKADELIIYYKDDHYIDLSNIDSLLVNTIKEMTQGVLLDKIYEERNINDILRIITRRRFENSCIREEYRKYKINKFQNINRNQNFKGQGNLNHNNYNKNNYNSNYMNNQTNNSGRYRVQNNSGQYRVQNNSGNFQRFAQAGHPGPNFNQNRWNQPRQGQAEPMEIDNIQSNRQINEVNYNNQGNNNNIQKTAQLGNPRTKGSQYRLPTPRQERNGFFERNSEEVNYDQLAGHSEPDPCHSNTAPSRQSQDQFFSERHQTTYPS